MFPCFTIWNVNSNLWNYFVSNGKYVFHSIGQREYHNGYQKYNWKQAQGPPAGQRQASTSVEMQGTKNKKKEWEVFF